MAALKEVPGNDPIEFDNVIMMWHDTIPIGVFVYYDRDKNVIPVQRPAAATMHRGIALPGVPVGLAGRASQPTVVAEVRYTVTNRANYEEIKQSYMRESARKLLDRKRRYSR